MKAVTSTTLVLLATLMLSFAGLAQNTLDLAIATGVSGQLADESTLNGRLSKGGSPDFVYRIGASYSAKLASRTHICVGGNYTSLATKRTFDPSDLRWGTQWNGTAFDPTISSGENFPKSTNVSRESHFEIPVTVRRYVGFEEKLYFLAGIVPALQLRYVNVINQEGGERVVVENTQTEFQKFQLATRIGVGTDWPITEKVKVFSQVQGQVHLIEEVKNSTVRWWDVSLKVGVRLGI